MKAASVLQGSPHRGVRGGVQGRAWSRSFGLVSVASRPLPWSADAHLYMVGRRQTSGCDSAISICPKDTLHIDSVAGLDVNDRSGSNQAVISNKLKSASTSPKSRPPTAILGGR